MNERVVECIEFLKYTCSLLDFHYNYCYIKCDGVIFNDSGKEVYIKETFDTSNHLRIQDNVYTLWIDLDKHKYCDKYETILYQTRRAYQHNYAYNNDNELAIQWKESFENGIKIDDVEHNTQPAILDCKAFVMYILFETFEKPMVTDVDVDIISPYVANYNREYDSLTVIKHMSNCDFNFERVNEFYKTK